MIPLGEWLPDLPQRNNPGAITAQNVIPHQNSYKPLAALSAYSSAISGQALGAFSVKDASGVVYIYVGDATALYRLNGTSFTDSSSATYTTASLERWEFVQWANTVIATNYSDEIQQITLGAANFANLGTSGTAPKARHIAVVAGFVVAGNTYDSTDGAVPYRLWWSSFEDPNTWPAIGSASAIANQSDQQDLYNDGGAIQAIVGGDYGVILQERVISRLDYVGAPLIFNPITMERGRGTIAPSSVISQGRVIYYLGEDGFYAFNGVESVPIGNGKVDRTFFSDLNTNYIDRISAAIDKTNSLVMWAYPSNSSTGNPDKVIIYNWVLGRWSNAIFDCELLLSSYTPGYTLDSLDSLSSSIDALAYSLDSRAYLGGTLQMASFDTSHQLATFTGSNLTGTVDTGEFQSVPGGRSFVRSVLPIVEGGTTSVQLGYRNNLTTSPTWSSAISLDSYGKANILNDALYHRVRLNMSATYTHALGVDIDFEASGAI